MRADALRLASFDSTYASLPSLAMAHTHTPFASQMHPKDTEREGVSGNGGKGGREEGGTVSLKNKTHICLLTKSVRSPICGANRFSNPPTGTS